MRAETGGRTPRESGGGEGRRRGKINVKGNDDFWAGCYVLDEQGNPRPERDLLAWAQWFETAERHVALTRFAWGEVSTVFLGELYT